VWIVAASAVLYALLVVPQWKPSWDSAIYISLAQSLAHGKGYAYMGYAHTKYPPGFPLVLSPIVLLFGKNYLLMRAFVAACAVGSVGMTYLLFRRIASVGVAVAVALITAAAFPLAIETTNILSDLPFMLASLSALYAAERSRGSSRSRWFWWTVTFIALSYLMRTVGFTLALAFAASLVLDDRDRPLPHRMRRAGIALGVVAIVIGGWMGRNALATHTLPEQIREGLSYKTEMVGSDGQSPVTTTALLHTLGRRVVRNLDYYDRLTASILSGQTASSTALIRAIGIWVLLGWLWALWRRRGLVEYYLPLYLVIYLLWPAHQGTRFLAPVVPILAYYALIPLLTLVDTGVAIAQRFGPPGEDDGTEWSRARTRARGLVLLISVGFFLMWNAPLLTAQVQVEHVRPYPYHAGGMGDYLETLAWVDGNLPRDAVLATNRAPYGVLLADRDTYTVPWVDDDAVKMAFLEDHHVTHVIANGGTPFLNQLIAAYPDRFHEIHRIGGTMVYAVQPAHPPS